MEVRITQEIHEAHKTVLQGEPFRQCVDDDRDYFRWNKHYQLNLGVYSKGALETLAAAVATKLEVRGAKTLARDVKAWIAACDTTNLETTKARTVKQACSLIIELLRRSPRQHIYTRKQEDAEGVTLAQFVGKIKYVPPDKRRDYATPEYVDIDWWWEEFGVVRQGGTQLYPDDCLGLGPLEILSRAGLFVETPELRAGYEAALVVYESVKDAVGKQFWGRGLADDSGIDGNDDEDDRDWWRSSRSSRFILDKDGQPSRVLIDVFREDSKEESNRGRDADVPRYFWKKQVNRTVGDDGAAEVELNEDDEEEIESTSDDKPPEVPIHPYVACFDLKRHKRLKIHSGNLEPYVYSTAIRDKLVMPQAHGALIDTLLGNKGFQFKDVVAGKTGGTVILCQGKPGTGKTLTAEIYAEAMERPLYTIQCAQLGVDAESLEDNLMKVLARGRRWNAVTLLDEADVYVAARGRDLVQNAVVGVFLRVLEYHAGVLFLTTNRGDLVDDAILSRCAARIPYDIPSSEDQKRIWAILAAANDLWLPLAVIDQIVAAYPNLSGRDIKNLLKLAALRASETEGEIGLAEIEAVRIFKPTTDGE